MARGKVVATVRVEGVKELAEKLGRISVQGTNRQVMEAALTKGAEPIRRAASAKAPRRSGLLSESIVVEPAVDRLMGFEGVGVFAAPGRGLGSRRTFYAHMQEFGTRHHGAQPFMRPAYDENRRETIQIVRRELGAAIEKAAR